MRVKCMKLKDEESIGILSYTMSVGGLYTATRP